MQKNIFKEFKPIYNLQKVSSWLMKGRCPIPPSSEFSACWLCFTSQHLEMQGVLQSRTWPWPCPQGQHSSYCGTVVNPSWAPSLTSPVLHNLCMAFSSLVHSEIHPSQVELPQPWNRGREALCFPSWCSCLMCSFFFPPSFYQSVVAEIMEIQALFEPSPDISRHIFHNWVS